MEKGDTFLMGSVGGNKKHLWILLSDLSRHHGVGVIVNLTTNQERSGGECPLVRGDHPWLTEKCWVSFGDAMCLPPEQWRKIQQGVAHRLILPQEPLGKVHLEKIISAAKVSRALPSVCLKFLE